MDVAIFMIRVFAPMYKATLAYLRSLLRCALVKLDFLFFLSLSATKNDCQWDIRDKPFVPPSATETVSARVCDVRF